MNEHLDVLTALPRFTPMQNNSTLTEIEQTRLETKTRLLYRQATSRIRGKQWEPAMQFIEQAKKICTALAWAEGIAYGDSLVACLNTCRIDNARILHMHESQERYEKHHKARMEKEAAETIRLEEWHRKENERVKEARGLIMSLKCIEIASLADALNVDERFLLKHMPAWVKQFGFKIETNKIIFSHGNVKAFIDEITKQLDCTTVS
nr:hypothetical protein [Candidatus Sigynarchaeota archaeon]